MDARDLPPSRLDRARRGAEELLARLGAEDRAGLAIFGSRGVLLAPLTPDRDALLEILSALDTGFVLPPGSDLGSGVAAALTAFAPLSERPRLLFVLSDGEDPERRREFGAAEAARAGVRVLAAVLGTDLGAEILDHGVPLRDIGGRVVHTRRDPRRLERLAGATGGAIFPIDGWGAFDFDGAARSIRRDAAAHPGTPVARRVRAVRVAPLALLAFGLLIAEMLPRGRRPLWTRWGLRARSPVSAGLAGVALLTGAAPTTPASHGEIGAIEARMRAAPGDVRLLVRLGLARLERDQTAAAARAFRAAAVTAREPDLAALAYYDLGVTELERGELEAARDAFFDALALAPGDRRARFNLEWTLFGLEARPPPAPAPVESEADSPAVQRTKESVPEKPPEDDETGEPASVPTYANPPPSESDRARMLARVRDDPTRAFRSASGRPESRRRSGPAW